MLYSYCKECGITIITISHRPSLFKYHQYLLRLGEGSEGDEWSFERIGTGASLLESVDAEIKKLEKNLEGMEGLRQRLEAINNELSLVKKNDDLDLKFAKRTLL